MNLVDETDVVNAVEAAGDWFGGIEVVVNNADYALLAAVEDVTDAEARDLFDVQIFGAWDLQTRWPAVVLAAASVQHGGASRP